jgi:deferrochelatase/peroxidase EfeB
MTLIDRFGAGLPPVPVTVDLDDIQATVLRYRPEPYYGTHVMLHVADAQAGREFVRRLTPHVDSAAGWWQTGQSWTSVAISYSGLVALGVPQDSLDSFPEPFGAGMAARAGQLRDDGDNAPAHWDAPFGSGQVHIGVSIFSDSEQAWHQTMAMARQQCEGFPGLTVLVEQDFGAQPGDLNLLGYKDSIGQPAIEGSGVDPLPGQGPPIKAGEFILGYPGQDGVPLPMPQPDVLGRNGTFAGLRKYQSRVGTFNRFRSEHVRTAPERELLAAKLIGRWRSGAPLTLAPEQRLQLRCRPRWPPGAARLAHAADEPARHQAGDPHRRQRPPHHPAQHDLRRALRPGRDLAAGRRDPPWALLHLHQRQGHGRAGVPAAGVDKQRQLHEPGRRARS